MVFTAILQQYFPPRPKFTEKNVLPGSQVGKVFIVTGANQGIGLELVRMLYPTGATIYLAGRSQERNEKAIENVVASYRSIPATPAVLKHLQLDLSDLTTIKASAAAFAAQEKKLDILWNNAGIGGNPEGTTTKQNIEGHVGINCIAPLLFTQELLPQLQEAAKTAPAGSVRIIWTGSAAIEAFAPPEGVHYPFLETGKTTSSTRDYAMSKVGNWYLAAEAARRWEKHGIVSVVENPGNLNTNIYSHQYWWLVIILKWTVLYEPKYGAYTMLYAGFTPDVGIGKANGSYIRPWGLLSPNGRQDLYQAIKAGEATKFWEWCENQYKAHV